MWRNTLSYCILYFQGKLCIYPLCSSPRKHETFLRVSYASVLLTYTAIALYTGTSKIYSPTKVKHTWLVSIIYFLIMKLFQTGLLFSLPVHTYLLTCETSYWSIFIYVYMPGCVKCHMYFSTFVFANESWFFLCRFVSFIFYWFGMVRRTLTISERWQAVCMHNGGISHRRVTDNFRVNHSIIVRLMQRFRQTGNVIDRPRAGRPRKTTPREDRLISRRARQWPFSTADALRGI